MAQQTTSIADATARRDAALSAYRALQQAWCADPAAVTPEALAAAAAEGEAADVACRQARAAAKRAVQATQPAPRRQRWSETDGRSRRDRIVDSYSNMAAEIDLESRGIMEFTGHPNA